MKKIAYLITILVIAILLLSVAETNLAYTVETDPDGIISFPWMITNGKGEIDIDESVSSYQLYYQSIEMSEADFSEREKTIEDQETFNENQKVKFEELENNIKTLEEQYNQIEDKESEEAKAIYAQYEQAIQVYDEAYEQYKTTFDSYTQKIKDLTPSFIEENWIETKDRTFDLQLRNFTGKKNFVLWVKLVDGANIVYDEAIYTVNGSKVEEERNWSDFSAVTLVDMKASGSTANPEENSLKVVLGNILMDSSVNHQFYFYFSNDSADIPPVDSEDWIMMPYEIEEGTGIVKGTITMDNLADLPYEVNWGEDVYMSVYEVISDDEIKTDTITGEYKLVCSSKSFSELAIGSGEDSEGGNSTLPEDNNQENNNNNNSSIADKEYPAAGISVVMVSAISIIMIIGIYGYIRYKRLRKID